jgi:hypothetical protein
MEAFGIKMLTPFEHTDRWRIMVDRFNALKIRVDELEAVVHELVNDKDSSLPPMGVLPREKGGGLG